MHFLFPFIVVPRLVYRFNLLSLIVLFVCFVRLPYTLLHICDDLFSYHMQNPSVSDVSH